MMDEFYKKRDAWLVQVLRHAIDQLQELRELDQLLKKRPVAFRVLDDNVWRVFTDEQAAREFADKIGIEGNLFQGLYVRDEHEAMRQGKPQMSDLPKELRRIADIELVDYAEEMMRKAADEIERCHMTLTAIMTAPHKNIESCREMAKQRLEWTDK